MFAFNIDICMKVDLKRVLKLMILLTKKSLSPSKSLPNKLKLKFSMDGRIIGGKQQVYIELHNFM